MSVVAATASVLFVASGTVVVAVGIASAAGAAVDIVVASETVVVVEVEEVVGIVVGIASKRLQSPLP